MTNWHKEYLSILPEVDQALRDHKPVVALESTVITHGLPFPENGNLANNLENEIRDKGCIPATIAILDGVICIGLDGGQLERLAQSKDMVKISTRDIASVVSMHKSGGTTVAGTLAIAQEVGIKVFATGGIGGVHRQAPFDVSADLGELARAKLVVVCAGAKAILDIPATLEVLETYGVPVIGYQTNEFPAFYSVSSGMAVSVRVNSAEEVAALAQTHWNLGFYQGRSWWQFHHQKTLHWSADFVETAIREALNEAQKKSIHGQSVTPFLLRRVSELTGGS